MVSSFGEEPIGIGVVGVAGLAEVFDLFLSVLPHLWQYQFWFSGGSFVIPTQCL